MVNAILSLLVNSGMLFMGSIGLCTIINKVGSFLKIMESEDNNGYKMAFDKVIASTLEEVNTSFDAIGYIASYSKKIVVFLYDVVVGNKLIKKDKDGKIIVSDNSKIHACYKQKIEKLSLKLRKYQNELKKVKGGGDKEEKDDSSSDDEDEKNEEFYLDSDT
jgi:hypothetical protein